MILIKKTKYHFLSSYLRSISIRGAICNAQTSLSLQFLYASFEITIAQKGANQIAKNTENENLLSNRVIYFSSLEIHTPSNWA